MAVHGVIIISSNDGNSDLATFNTVYMGSTYDMEIRQDGIVFEGLKSDGTQIPAKSWTYEGKGKFLGLSTTSGATAPDDGCSVGSTIKFEGLDDAYYYIVEEELQEEKPTPTADSVKSKLQSLLTASNAKTGKSDTNLTDAVKTLIEGYGQGGGECSGNHIIEVDELPTENIDETALYKVGDSYYKYGGEFKDVIQVENGTATSIVELYEQYGLTIELFRVKTKPTENIVITDFETGVAAIYYVEDDGDAFTYDGSAWNAIGATGIISDASEATEDGIYVIYAEWVSYVVVSGNLKIVESGTHDVSTYASATVNVPASYMAQTVAELPTDATDGSMAIVLGGE